MHQKPYHPFAYFLKNVKLFLAFIAAYLKRDEKKLEKIYLDTLDLYHQHMELNLNECRKKEIIKELIYELLEILEMRDQNEQLSICGKSLFKGIKIKEKIIDNRYIELWVRGNKIWLYVFENSKSPEQIYPYTIENPFLINNEQVYHALKEKVYCGI